MSDSIDRQKVLNTLDFIDKACIGEERTVEKYKELLTECIKVLPSSENDGDLISRQAVLETIDSRIEQIKKNTNAMNKSYPHLSFAEGVHDGYCRLKCDLRILPSVSVSENPNKWIPVSERLPEIHQDVLLSLRSLDVDTGFRAENEPYFYVHGYYIDPQDVLAWQPLPEPCKADMRGNDDEQT